MVKKIVESRFVNIPDEVKVTVTGSQVKVTGSLGILSRSFSDRISIKVDGNKIITEAYWPDKKLLALVGTVTAHLRNMIAGVTKSFTYKLKIVFSHFPISVKVQSDRVLIENFGGERSSRAAKIVGDTKVKVEGDDIIVTGNNKESVGQTAANIEKATNIKNKDPRVFLDGIYVYERNLER
jgi:large subunit ribosomal protein L6